MKQVVFAVLLMAMASLTGCLNTEDSPVDDKTDDTTSDTTDDNTDTTEDNSDTTDDTKDDELIEPVGTDGGYSPPEDSSVFINFPENAGVLRWDCTPSDPKREGFWDSTNSTYDNWGSHYYSNLPPEENITGYRGNDSPSCEYIAQDFPEDYVSTNNNLVNYSWDGNNINSDLLVKEQYTSETEFRGWVNKTTNKVTIEGLYNPYHDDLITNTTHDWSGDCTPGEWDCQGQYSDAALGMPIGSCHGTEGCHITVFGNGGIHFTTIFTLSHWSEILIGNEQQAQFILFYGGIINQWNYHFYQPLTVTIDLPFEPLMFTITDNSGKEITRLF
ncbi:hypothetical protein OAO35_00175 [Euryarchaeota archaeon]|nr:hypothetical protein [Euryarchaeota archaeon]